ncbi:tudor domain-containing protein 5-like isoform X7 [Leptotrombidium deliense]|uniref:Tudor domain-containing protein 5-like isoform X7 n=1 Tax=Leptotrombidium deliense TaxID=299467 RepID=A0A443S7Q6_9ACAR|nr:tudor domain-containing protein 5-like isoform X7 [Leptotrombidium deliense]
MSTKKILEFIRKQKQISEIEVLSTSPESGYYCSSASDGSLTNDEKELNIPPLVIATFKRILSKFTSGVTASTFYEEYYKECGYEMDPSLWGIRSPTEVFYSLPSIFLIIPPEKGETDHLLYDVNDCPKEVIDKLNNLKLREQEKDLNSNSQVDAKLEIDVYKILHLNEKVTITNFAELYRNLTGKQITPEYFGFQTFAQFFMQLRSKIAVNFDGYTLRFNESGFQLWIINDCIRSKMLPTAKFFINFPADVALPGEKLKTIQISEDFIAIENENNDSKWKMVQITAADDFSKIFLQLKENESDYASFSDRFQQFFASANNKTCIPKQFLVKGFVCAVRPAGDYYWYRAVIRKVHSDDEVTVNLVDFGYRERVQSNLLRFIPRRFIDFEVQAIRVSLHDIQAIDSKTNAASLLEYSTPEIWLHCLFYPKTNNIHAVILKHVTDDGCVNINDDLIKKQLATRSKPMV